jgi:hypothetical protein
MSRSYHTDIAAVTCIADNKWVDNLLSRNVIPGVDGGGQGSARRITQLGIYHVALARLLSADAGLALPAAVSMARQLLSGTSTHVAIAPGLDLRIDRQAFEQDVDRRLAAAVEAVVPARRGRPPGGGRRGHIA